MADKIPGGYYIKARKIQESDIMRLSPCTREVWDWLLCNANYKTGEVMASYNDVRYALAWYVGWRKRMYTTEQIKVAYEALRKTTRITTRKTTRKTVVTIKNYLYYQDPSSYAKTTQKTDTKTEGRLDEGPDDKQTINKNNNYTAQNDAPNKKNTQKPKKDDPVTTLYYQAVRALGLPILNHKTLQQKIAEMKAEAPEKELIDYLELMRDKFAKLQIEYKPDINKALDIYDKRVAVINAIKRAKADRASAKRVLSPEEIKAQEQRDREQDAHDAEMQRQLHARATAGEFSGKAVA